MKILAKKWKKKERYYSLYLLCFFFFLPGIITSCGFRREKSNIEDQQPVQAQFASIQRKILLKKCQDCHSPANPKGGVDLSSYTKIMNASSPRLIIPGSPEQSLLYQVIRNGSMPKDSPRLSAIEMKAIYDWINSGAPEQENGSLPVIPQPPPLVIPEKVDYTNLYTAILKPRCIRCHSESCSPTETCKIEGFVDLSTYNELMNNFIVSDLVKPGDAAGSKLFISVNTADMPRPKMPDQSNRITAEEIKYIERWINEGAKENSE